MPKKPSNERQPELPWATRRGQELRALRMLDLNDPHAKLLLLSCDLIVSQETGFYDITLDELRRVANMSRSTFYDRLKRLQRLGLITVRPLTNSTRQRVWINRGTLAQLALSGAAIAVREPESVRVADAVVRETDAVFREPDNHVREPDAVVRETDCTTYGPTEPTEPSAPSEPNRVEEATWDLVMTELVELGVIKWNAAIAVLQEHVTPEHAIALCRHYRQFHVEFGWSAASLFFRCQRARQSIAPETNWPEKQATSQHVPVDLESEYGPTLDALTLEMLVDLVRQSDATTQGLFAMVKPREARRQPTLRMHLLRMLARRVQQ